MIAKIAYIIEEMWFMIKQHKVYFLAPVLLMLAMLAIFVYYMGPTAIVSFLYAGL